VLGLAEEALRVMDQLSASPRVPFRPRFLEERVDGGVAGLVVLTGGAEALEGGE
jgi:hypothetical protein